MRRIAIWVGLVAALCAGCSSAADVTGGHGAASTPVTSARSAPTVQSAAPAAAAPPATSKRPSAPDACAHNTLRQRVIVDISAQHVWLCTGAHTAYQSAVTTGAVDLPYDSTPLGTFHVQGRNRDTTLTLADGASYQVHYWVPFDAPLFGFHDAQWQQLPFGSPAYRTRGSHGCVHMPLAAMSYLYHWAPVGTTVTIRA